MPEKFFNIHLIQASLQALQVPMPEIKVFLNAFENLALSPESFSSWNRELDDKGITVLAMLLKPNADGKKLAEACLEGIFSSMVEHYKLTDTEIIDAMRTRIHGLN